MADDYKSTPHHSEDYSNKRASSNQNSNTQNRRFMRRTNSDNPNQMRNGHRSSFSQEEKEPEFNSEIPVMNLKELKEKHISELVHMAKDMGIEGSANLRK